MNLINYQLKGLIYYPQLATFEEDNLYNQQDAEGFIKLKSLRFKT